MSELDRLARAVEEEAKALAKKLPWWAEVILGIEVAIAIAILVLSCFTTAGTGCIPAIVILIGMILISVYVYLDEGSEKDELKDKLRRAKRLASASVSVPAES